MFTIVEIYNEDTADLRSINHHGSERKVFNKNITEVKIKKNGFMLTQKYLRDVAKFVGKYNYILVYLNDKIKIFHCSYLESRGIPIFVLIFALSYSSFACLIYFNLFD